jgi:lipoyl-dependent peroxiredoxin
MKTHGSAVWQGGIKDGKGAISTKSGALKAYPYGFSSRFEGKPGTNPEELIGAAHAGCFTMALSLILGEAKLTAEHMETTAEVTLDKVADGFAITAVHLTLRAKVPGADQAKLEELAAKAKAGCPVSKLLNANITLEESIDQRRHLHLCGDGGYSRAARDVRSVFAASLEDSRSDAAIAVTCC